MKDFSKMSLAEAVPYMRAFTQDLSDVDLGKVQQYVIENRGGDTHIVMMLSSLGLGFLAYSLMAADPKVRPTVIKSANSLLGQLNFKLEEIHDE